ncbi:4031_t:CDS:2, partial [Funneliformis geosporum]
KFLGHSRQSSETFKRKPNSATDGKYHNIDEKVFMFCTWCKKAGYNNQFAKGCNTYKKDLIDRHVKIKSIAF